MVGHVHGHAPVLLVATLVCGISGVTAADFASCSDKVWGHFALAGATRKSKQELLDRGIIAKLTAEEKAAMAADSKVVRLQPPSSMQCGPAFTV